MCLLPTPRDTGRIVGTSSVTIKNYLNRVSYYQFLTLRLIKVVVVVVSGWCGIKKVFLFSEMPGIRVVSERQLELLLQFMEKNPILAKGSLTNEGPLAKLTTEKKWKTIAARLNNEGSGCNKSHIKWREVSVFILSYA